MTTLWHQANVIGGPLDGATVCVPLRQSRIDHWVWAHECVIQNDDTWTWADACVSGFYQLSDTAGSIAVDVEELDETQTYRWCDLHLSERITHRWEHGD